MVNLRQWARTKLLPKLVFFLREFAILMSAFLLLNNFVIASFMVPTGSMENEVLTGELLFVSRITYGGSTPRYIPFTNVRLPWVSVPGFRRVERNDPIVFVFPGNRDEVMAEEFAFYLKRCVAIPGDTVLIVDKALYINGLPAHMPPHLKYSFPGNPPSVEPNPGMFPKGVPWNEDNYGPLVVPYEGMTIELSPETFEMWETFVRREGHQITRDDEQVFVDGAAVDEYVVERDYLFGMGDHRDNSLDSRYWGFIPEEDVVGTPLIVYWSWDSDIPITDIFSRLSSIRWNRLGAFIR